MKLKTPISVRNHMLLSCIVLIVPILMLMIYQTWYYTSDRARDEATNVTNIATRIASEAQQRHQVQQRMLASALRLAPELARPMDKDTCLQQLGRLVERNEFMNSLALYTADGQTTCTTGAPFPARLAQQAFFRNAVQNKSATSSAFISQDGHESGGVYFVQPILDGQDTVRSVIVTQLGLDWIDESVARLPVSANTNIVVVDSQGAILMPERWRGRSVADHPVFQRITGGDTRPTFEAEGIDGVTRIFAAQTLISTTLQPSYVWVAAPRISLRETAIDQFSQKILLAFILFLAALFWVWQKATRLIFTPIQQLRSAAAHIAHEEFAARSDLPHSPDEIGDLARSFDEMAVAIEDKVHWLNLIIDSANLGFWDLDLINDKVTHSLRYNQILGYDSVQPTQDFKLFEKHIPAEELDAVRALFYEAFNTGRFNIVTRIIRVDGCVRWIDVQGQTIYDDQHRPVRVLGVISDITERKLAEAELLRLNRTLHALTECNKTLVRSTDEAELLNTICRHIVEIGGYSLAWVGFAQHDEAKTILPMAVAGMNLESFSNLRVSWCETDPSGCGPTGTAVRENRIVVIHDFGDDERLKQWQARVGNFGFASAIVLPLRDKNGLFGSLTICANDTNVFDEKEINLLEELTNDLAYGVTNLRETRMREEIQQKLNYQANYDPLTGLANRTLLLDLMGQSIVHAQRHDRLVAMVFIDIDRFKPVNESLSHGSGDLLLKLIGERLLNQLRHGDTVARLSADEFGVLMADMASADDAIPLVRNLLECISEPFNVNGQELFITASAGISFYPKDETTVEALLQFADAAMNGAKKLGGNTLCCYSEEMNRHISSRFALDNALRKALEHGDLEVHYQPKVNLTNGQIIGAEALIRWPHAEMGMISPAEFIPLAEETGLIVPLDEWVLDQVCRQIRELLDAGLPSPPIAVNLSGRQFHQENLTNTIRATLNRHQLEASQLTLEITEGTAMVDVEKTIATLHELKAIGVTLSLDDFGTGYSSLSYLKRFPLDHLKIDRSFVRDVTTDPDDAAICKAIIGLAHNLKMSVIAEGVETESQMEHLRQQSCDEIQGFLFSKAVPAQEYAKMLAERKKLKLPETASVGDAQRQRTLLLVDDEENILTSLKRLLRRDGHHILTATSAAQGLELLSSNHVDVIISDQRMPGMTGVEFLRRAKVLYPDTIRIMLSGYADLQSVTDVINEGAVYKFLTKPWEDGILRASIDEAFRHQDMAEENRSLQSRVAQANIELAAANEQLAKRLTNKELQLLHDRKTLEIAQEALQYLPWPILGIEDSGLIVLANPAAEALFNASNLLLGSSIEDTLPSDLCNSIRQCSTQPVLGTAKESVSVTVLGTTYRVRCNLMGYQSDSHGLLVTLVPEKS